MPALRVLSGGAARKAGSLVLQLGAFGAQRDTLDRNAEFVLETAHVGNRGRGKVRDPAYVAHIFAPTFDKFNEGSQVRMTRRSKGGRPDGAAIPGHDSDALESAANVEFGENGRAEPVESNGVGRSHHVEPSARACESRYRAEFAPVGAQAFALFVV